MLLWKGRNRPFSTTTRRCVKRYTIVDLMRNDLNSVATDVHVERFRYVERIATSSGAILQTNSEITGRLAPEMAYRFGDVILPMLPAGSITGAPKEATVELIRRAEPVARGWYTGVFGYFDGEEMQTAVVIRCLQRAADGRLFLPQRRGHNRQQPRGGRVCRTAGESVSCQMKGTGMPDFIETIRVVDGSFRLLPLHAARMRATCREAYGCEAPALGLSPADIPCVCRAR